MGEYVNITQDELTTLFNNYNQLLLGEFTQTTELNYKSDTKPPGGGRIRVDRDELAEELDNQVGDFLEWYWKFTEGTKPRVRGKSAAIVVSRTPEETSVQVERKGMFDNIRKFFRGRTDSSPPGSFTDSVSKRSFVTAENTEGDQDFFDAEGSKERPPLRDNRIYSASANLERSFSAKDRLIKSEGGKPSGRNIFEQTTELIPEQDLRSKSESPVVVQNPYVTTAGPTGKTGPTGGSTQYNLDSTPPLPIRVQAKLGFGKWNPLRWFAEESLCHGEVGSLDDLFRCDVQAYGEEEGVTVGEKASQIFFTVLSSLDTGACAVVLASLGAPKKYVDMILNTMSALQATKAVTDYVALYSDQISAELFLSSLDEYIVQFYDVDPNNQNRFDNQLDEMDERSRFNLTLTLKLYNSLREVYQGVGMEVSRNVDIDEDMFTDENSSQGFTEWGNFNKDLLFEGNGSGMDQLQAEEGELTVRDVYANDTNAFAPYLANRSSMLTAIYLMAPWYVTAKGIHTGDTMLQVLTREVASNFGTTISWEKFSKTHEETVNRLDVLKRLVSSSQGSIPFGKGPLRRASDEEVAKHESSQSDLPDLPLSEFLSYEYPAYLFNYELRALDESALVIVAAALSGNEKFVRLMTQLGEDRNGDYRSITEQVDTIQRYAAWHGQQISTSKFISSLYAYNEVWNNQNSELNMAWMFNQAMFNQWLDHLDRAFAYIFDDQVDGYKRANIDPSILPSVVNMSYTNLGDSVTNCFAWQWLLGDGFYERKQRMLREVEVEGAELSVLDAAQNVEERRSNSNLNLDTSIFNSRLSLLLSSMLGGTWYQVASWVHYNNEELSQLMSNSLNHPENNLLWSNVSAEKLKEALVRWETESNDICYRTQQVLEANQENPVQRARDQGLNRTPKRATSTARSESPIPQRFVL